MALLTVVIREDQSIELHPGKAFGPAHMDMLVEVAGAVTNALQNSEEN